MANLKGFTLIELMITIVIVAIMVTIAAPGFKDLIIKNRLDGIATDFLGNLALARSEAVKRGDPVSVCARGNGTTCAGGSWNNGWIVFVDSNANGAIDTGDTVLRIRDSLGTNYTGASDNFPSYITYQRDGMASSTGIFVFCHSSDETTARGVIATLTRPKFAPDTNNNNIPEKEDTSGNLSDIGSCEAP